MGHFPYLPLPTGISNMTYMTMQANKILIVDDEAALVQMCKFILENAGFSVRGAFNGTQALHMVAEEMPDLIILDVMMPGMTGHEVCQTIRQTYGLERPYIMMYSADDRDNTIERCLAAGADEYISKTTSPFDLPSKVRAALVPT